MARQTAQAKRDAPGFLDPRDLGDAPEDFPSAWCDDKPSSSLLRGALDRVSDYTFVAAIADEVARQLRDAGLPEDLALSMIPELLRSPSFAVEKRDGELVRVRHAVIIGRDETKSLPFEVILRADVRVRRRHMPAGEKVSVPGTVVGADVTAVLADLEADADVGAIMTEFLSWLEEFPAPVAAARSNSQSVVFLGSPLALGCASAPEHWRQDLTRLADAFGLAAVFHHGPDFNGTVGARVRQVFRFEPYRGKEPVGPDGEEIPSVEIDVRLEPYPTVFERVAVALANHEDPDDISPFAKRPLKPGEKVYHRKVGNNRRYDNFDEGSTTACSHGEGSFIRFGRDKSRKGMAHRYSNFEVSWLRHCSKFPNCNVYAVFAPA